MLRMTVSLAILALVSLAVSRMSCFAQNEEPSLASTTSTDFLVEEAVSGVELTEFPELSSLPQRKSVDDVFGNELAVVPEIAAATNANPDTELPVFAPAVATPMTREPPAFALPTAPVAPEVETVEDIAWQDFQPTQTPADDPFFPEPPATSFPADGAIDGAPQLSFPDDEPIAAEEAIVDAEEAADEDPNQKRWQPAFNVILNQPADAPPARALISQTVVVQVEKTIKRRGQQVVEKVPETRQILSISGGVTLIRCDDIDVRVANAGENAGSYEFEIAGRLELRNASVTIESESAALKDGELTLKSVTLKSPHTMLRSDEIKLELTVNSLRIGEPIEVNGTPNNNFNPTPAPSVFQPAVNSVPDPYFKSSGVFQPRRGTLQVQ